MKQLLLLSGILFSVFAASAQQPLPSPKATAEAPNVKVTYGQPSKKGRVIFGDLVPYGKVWRTGANEATEITFAKDATFAGKPVKAGTYTLFTIPTEKQWTIILNSELKQWGAFGYEKVKDKDVLHVDVPVKKTSDVAEKLTYTFEGSNLVIKWEQTQVSIPVKA